MNPELGDFFFNFDYKFTSGTGPMEGYRYVRNFDIKIFANSGINQKKFLAGKVVFKIIYVENAINDGYDLYEIFDSYEYTFRHGSEIFNFEEQDIKEDIRKHFNYDILGSKICLLERIELLPSYRGFKLDGKIIKDIVFHFNAKGTLFVIQAFSLQFEPQKQEQSYWEKQLELNHFTTNKKIAFKKLEDYYKSFGFERIRGYEGLLFYNSMRVNDKMDSINLEE